MSLLGKLKSLLGGDDGAADDESRDVSVTVEREAGTASSSTDATADSTTADRTASEPDPTDEPETTEKADEPETAEDTDADTESEPGDDATPVEDIKGVGPTYADRLGEAEINSVEQLANADAETLADKTGISETRLQNWIDQANVR